MKWFTRMGIGQGQAGKRSRSHETMAPSASSASFPHTEFLQHDFKRTKLREAALKQIGADKNREPQKVFTHEKRALRHAECQGNEDENSRKHANHPIGVHSQFS
jgi:hypothetical protein